MEVSAVTKTPLDLFTSVSHREVNIHEMIITNTLWLTILSFAAIPITAQNKQKPLFTSNHNKMEDFNPSTSGGWKPVLDPTNNSTIIGHHWRSHDYVAGEEYTLALQTLDLWTPVSPSSLLFGGRAGAPWLIYIHGGAWRDPAIDSSSFNASATKILSSLSQQPPEQRKKKLAGIASINYRLSPYPNHPTNPSDDPTDPNRNAKHPAHIADVLTALGFLKRYFGMESYVLAGHSCGATLALQACMSPKRWGLDRDRSVEWRAGWYDVAKPKTVVGFNGLYDLAGFIESPPKGYERWREAYREFVVGAFGEKEEDWKKACPGSIAEGWVGEWNLTQQGEEGKKRKVVLVQSLEDSLVPVEQTEGMAGYFERENEKVGEESGKVEVVVLREEKAGDHDEVWQRGERLGEILVGVLEGEI
ncbi:alpha/beta-hydrolase [Neurospora tetraspora]|uniref:Kynurenine formamidase n=1 Tax=Neurospora tetraspora TaxID=94610 RepID=A0AAE0JF53_9PEZI|nr:alpha/beta-hydrolase [Neurospora tetraspora]